MKALPALLVVVLGVQVAAQSRPTAGDIPFLIEPSRRAPITTPSPLPDLPDAASNTAPLTIEIEILERGSDRRSAVRQVVTRTADRVHLQSEGREWVFERNPIDPRRVSGSLIDHSVHAIVLHGESDLRNTLGITGWIDVLTFGVGASVPQQFSLSRGMRQVGDVRFERFTSPTGRIAELWWNQELLLPQAIRMRQSSGSTDWRIVAARHGADAGLLRSPPLRLPDYKVLDLADWLEDR